MVATNITCGFSIIFTILALVAAVQTRTCTIYCEGKILDMVQTSDLYKDSKSFVDMKMKYPANVIIARFDNMLRNLNDEPSDWSLKRFLRKHFIGPGDEFDTFRPHDWKEEPDFLHRIHDNRLKKWAKELNSYWMHLCRKVRLDVRENADKYSLLYLSNPLVMPGGTFREFRYWDTYWIILGLLRCEMFNTVRGMIDDLIHLVDEFGFIPNGGRIYHLGRSEIPLLIPMVMMYYQFTHDEQFIESNINTLESEFKFWMDNRCVELRWQRKNIKLAHYDGGVSKPRPEAYREDVELASQFSSNDAKAEIYTDLRAASEAGWDFSSRWLIHNGSRSKNLSHIKTREIIPVDLNAILCWNARILSKFYELINEDEKALEYTQVASDWQTSLTALLWSENDGSWFDYDKLNKKKRKYFYASNLTPLWTKCYDRKKTDHIAVKIVKYLSQIGVTYFEGGIPVSTFRTDHKFDFPTAVPPYQHIIIMGLKYTENWEAKELAFKLAFNWVRANYKGFISSGVMFDRYHCKEPGAYGGKAKYLKQMGYGWTNGVCLDLLYNYGSVIHSFGIHSRATGRLNISTVPALILLLSLIYL